MCRWTSPRPFHQGNEMCCCSEFQHCGVVYAGFALTFVNRWLMRTSSCSFQRQLLSTGWQKNIIKYFCLSHKLKCVGLHTCTWHHSVSCRNLGQAEQIEEGAGLKRHYSIHNNPNLTICREKKVVVCCWRSSKWTSGGWSTALRSLTYYVNSCSLEMRFSTEKEQFPH